MSETTGIVLFVVGILVSIMIHEWGHFATARRFGMRADRYFLGFGPTLWSTMRGETEYGVKALPLGGFVRIVGMSPMDERRPPIGDEWLDADTLAVERREVAEGTGVDLLAVPSITDPTLRRLDGLLAQRGTSTAIADAIMADVRAARPDTPDDARAALDRAVGAHVRVPTGRDTSSLHHRLTRGDQGRFFGDKPAWQRAIVLAAGSGLHFAIAIVVMLGGLLLLPQATGEVTSDVDSVVAGSPAEAAGLQSGDTVLSVNGVQSGDFFDLRDEILDNPGTPVALEVARGDQTLTLTATPEATTDQETGATIGLLGFVPVNATARLGPGDALHATFVGPASIPRLTAASAGAIVDVFGPDGIGAMFSQISGDQDRGVAGGISMVGGATVTGQGVSSYGVMFLLSILVSINVFIGLFNMLPLPPLDGGHLAVLAVEKVVNWVRRLTGRKPSFKISPQTVAAIALPVLLLIGTVGLGLVWLDITNPIQLP